MAGYATVAGSSRPLRHDVTVAVTKPGPQGLVKRTGFGSRSFWLLPQETLSEHDRETDGDADPWKLARLFLDLGACFLLGSVASQGRWGLGNQMELAMGIVQREGRGKKWSDQSPGSWFQREVVRTENADVIA
jgi:hypothetical protein